MPPFCYMTPEGINTQYLKRRVKDLGGIARKCTWSGIAGAPDWLIAFPAPQCHAWVELKAPGKASRPLQEGARQGLAASAGAGAADPAAVRMRRLCLRQPGEHRQRPFCAF